MKYCIILLSAFLAGVGASTVSGKEAHIDLSTVVTPVYKVEGNAFVRHNGDRYLNRSLYCNHIYGAVLAGDKPYGVLGNDASTLGNLMFAFVRDGKGQWLQNATDITSKYRPGRMEWIVKDKAWGATVVHVEMAPAAVGAGLVAHVRVEQAMKGDLLIWASGAAVVEKQRILWKYDMCRLPGKTNIPLMGRGFDPADCQGNETVVNGNSWTVGAICGITGATGRCSVPTKMVVGDANAWEDPVGLLQARGYRNPIACGSLPVSSDQDIYWAFLQAGAGLGKSPAEEFAAGMQRVEALEKRVVVDTPDSWLNAAVGASSIAEDAVFRDGIYTHCGMRWSKPFIGWRTIFGGTVYGSHSNVKKQAALCISNQITQSDKTAAAADPQMGLSSQSAESRLFGKGRIDIYHPSHYNMQTQFFDQLLHAWQWTGDAELESLLRPALDLHCDYVKDCFDPEGLGIYESYTNTWPTDNQWYNGGGTSEETAYAYRAESVALKLAQRANDQAGIQRHSAAIERIRKGFFDLLWVPEKGHPGAYREQGGLKRLHESSWLYAIFCPIDAGLLSPEQSAQALHYTEWALERMKMPYGGEQCWPSNWVPSIWSVREMYAGDDYHLALAYFQTGLPDEGWKILRGMFPQQLLFGTVPGDMGHPSGGTDSADCNSMFARAVVEGLFGYSPDYPEGVVKITPQLPSDWDHASIKTPDMSIAYRRAGSKTSYDITLTKAAALDVRIPVSTRAVSAVTVDGKPVQWELLPGFGRSIVKLSIPSTASASVKVTTRDALKAYSPVSLSGNSSQPVRLQAEDGKIVDFHDPQKVLSKAKLENGAITGVLTANAGDHLVFGLTQVGETTQWRLFKIHVTDLKADAELAAKTTPPVPTNARWEEVALDPVLNGDIRTIYQQQYLSPRPNTCSLRLATDGYSTWQMALGGLHPPQIDFSNIKALLDKSGRIVAGNGVPFLAPGETKNIAFTSRWDNWPKQVTVDVHKTGDSVWFLVCGSTNPMQVRIPNAELRMTYEDGLVEKLELVPPFNFWALCHLWRIDYDYERDGFSLPKIKPTTLQLGKNCRAMVLGWRLRPGIALKSVTLETLSQEVVIGLMGITVMQ